MNNILIFGDSISAGKGVNKNKSWPSLLAQNFDNRDKYSTIIYNLSIPGESTNEILLRFSAEVNARYISKSADNSYMIIFAIGINDAKSIGSPNKAITSVNDFNKNIKKLIKLARKYTNRIAFIGLTPVDESKAAQVDTYYFLNKNILNYNNNIKNICVDSKISFIEIARSYAKTNFKRYLANDGIHLNESGHKMIYKKICDFINFKPNTNQVFNPYQILKKEYNLQDNDIYELKSKFINNTIVQNDFFFGQLNNEEPEIVIGAPCIRKDIEGFSLNTFSQIFIPIKVASIMHVPCKIFIGVKEEIIFQPKSAHIYKQLGCQLEKVARCIAKELDVDIEIVDTSCYGYDKIINESIRELGINLSAEDSTYLYNFSHNRIKKQLHSQLRILANKRVIACNTSYVLNKLFGYHHNLIVEDIEQYFCTAYAKKFARNNNSPNFLAFLPLPNVTGTASMFKSETDKRFLLQKDDNYYKSIYNNSPSWVIETYWKLFGLVAVKENIQNYDVKLFINIVKQISNYFSSND